MTEVTGHLAAETPIDYFEDLAEMAEAVGGATIERLVGLIGRASELDADITKLSVELAEAQEARIAIVRVQLPEIMAELNMAEFKLDDGTAITIAPKVTASISEANRPAAFRWLEETDNDGIIKTKVVSTFGKGEAKEAKEAQELLAEKGIYAELDRSVHNATLTSFVKERLAAGDVLPPSFTVFEFKEAKIKAPAKRKK